MWRKFQFSSVQTVVEGGRLLSPIRTYRMINKKRGNIFESLNQTNEEKAATLWDLDSRKTNLEDFKTLGKRLEKIGEDSSEVREELQRLRDQVEDFKKDKLDPRAP